MAGTAGKGHRQTEQVLSAVCDGLKAGLPIKRAAMSAGISEKTFHNWRGDGWHSIERTDQDSDAEMSFVVQFALQTEAAICAYMAPLIQRVSEAALSGGKGDWRAAAMILQGRFPHEFSERLEVAKSQRVEIGGTISHDFSLMRLQSMSDAELRAELEGTHWSMRSSMLFGDELGEVISYMEDKLSLMRHHYAAKTAFFPDREDSWRPGSGRGSKAESGIEPKLIEHEDNEIQAAVLQAPDTAEGSGVVARPSATPSVSFHVNEEPPARGIGYRADGLAYNLGDEDLSL